MKFHKYHALGNDYLVLDPKNFEEVPSSEAIRRICHRNLGIGSDGILWGPLNQGEGKENFNLRIFNNVRLETGTDIDLNILLYMALYCNRLVIELNRIYQISVDFIESIFVSKDLIN